ncbi:hypothetical protein [Xanthomonas sacchari]|uniref:hypothetical protein n=1 Tax=Xanthomonas sacchari TaxID=56458 RepID=UPI003D187C61
MAAVPGNFARATGDRHEREIACFARTTRLPGLWQRIRDRLRPAGQALLSPRFKVYKFERQGVTYVQINSAQDEVLTAMIVTPGAQQQLPIGSAAATPMVFVESSGQP